MTYPSSRMLFLIEEYVNGKRAARNREILRLRFIDGLTFAEIAAKMELSEIQVSRIVHRYGDPLLMMLGK